MGLKIRKGKAKYVVQQDELEQSHLELDNCKYQQVKKC